MLLTAMLFLLFWGIVQGISCPVVIDIFMDVMPVAEALFVVGNFFLFPPFMIQHIMDLACL